MSGSVSGLSNGGIDPSIPLQAGRGVPQANPLASIGQFAGAANSLNQLKLFPGQMQLQQQAIQGGATDLAQKQLGTAYRSLIPLLAKKPGTITVDDVATGLGSAEHNLGLVTQPVLADISANAPPPNSPEYDSYIRSRIASMSQGSPETGVAQVTPHPGPILDNGQQLQPTTVNPAGLTNPGVPLPVGPATPTYPSRGQLGTQVSRPATAEDVARDPSLVVGQMLNETTEQRLVSQGAGHLVSPGVVSRGGAPVGPQNPPRLPAAAIAPPAPAVPAAPASGRAVAGGLPPGAQQEYEASAAQYNGAQAAANTFKQRVFPLEQAAAALKNADTGPGSETVNHIKSFLLAQAPTSLQSSLPGVDPTKIANYDEAVKYLAQYAMNQPGAANSDMHLGLAQAANASTHISAQAAQQVVQNALGLERMQQAALAEFNATHAPGSGQQYSRWLSGQFIPQNDPRGFSWDTQSAAQQKAALASMTRADKERLARSVSLGRKYELTGPIGGQ